MTETVTTLDELETLEPGTIVRDAAGRLGEVQGGARGARNSVLFVGMPQRLWWNGIVRAPGITLPLSVVLRPHEEATLVVEVGILTPGGVRHETHPASHTIEELTLESATSYVERRNARERHPCSVQTRRVTDWSTVR